MNFNTSLLTCVIVSSLLSAAPRLAQSKRSERPNHQPADPQSGGSVDTRHLNSMMNPNLGNFAGSVLQPRPLKDADLSDAERRKYTASTATIERQAAAPARGNQSPNPTQPVAGAFRLGLNHLRYKQETKALEAFTQGWTGVPELLKEAKNTPTTVSLIKPHLTELQKLVPQDPALVLAFMTSLAPLHEAALSAVAQPKLKPQLVMPLAATWTHLMQLGQLDKDSLGKGAGWVLMFPNLLVANRPLPPEMRSNYETQLTQVNVKITENIRLLAERQRTQIGGNYRPMTPGSVEAHDNDPRLQQTMANLDMKRGPIMQFMSADIAFRFGQYQDGLRATNAGWKELIDFYRANAGGANPADTDMHFDILSEIVATNPVLGAVMLDQFNPAYGTVAPTLPYVSVKVADNWAKVVADLPLNVAMLNKAQMWVESASKTNKDNQARYTTSLAEIKGKLEQAIQKEKGNEATDQRHGQAGHPPKENTPPQQPSNDRFNIRKNLGISNPQPN